MHRKRFITNTVFLFASSMIAQVISLFVLPLFIKNLGQEMYGIFVISNMLIGYVGLFDFGLTNGLTRYIGRAYSEEDHETLSRVVSTGFWLMTVLGLLSGWLIYFGRFAILDFLHVEGLDRPIAARLLIVTAIFSVIQWPMRLPQAILKGALRIKELSVFNAVQATITSVAMLALVLASSGVVGIRAGLCLVIVASWIPLLSLVRKCVPELIWHPFYFSTRLFRQMSSFSLGMFYTNFLSTISSRIDTLIIGNMLSVALIPAYVVVERIHRFVLVMTNQIFGAVLPTVFSLDTDQNRSKLQTMLDGMVRYRALLISPLAYLGVVIGPSFVRTWMGEDYVQYAIWSQLFMLPIFGTVFGVGVNIARGTGRLKLCNILLSIRVFSNLALSIILVPWFGIGGPILGTIFGSTVLGDAVFFPLFCKVSNLSFQKAWRTGWLIMLTNAPVAGLALVLLHHVELHTWAPLLGVTCALTLIFYGTLYFCFVGDSEKGDLLHALDSLGLKKAMRVRGWVVKAIGLGHRA